MASPQMKERLSGVVLNTVSKGASPESKCPICLDHFKNISYLDVCLHKFCFCCICEWLKNKAECPLCKQPFNSIYHTIKSEDNYKRLDLRPTENGSFGNMAGQRFRYSTTLTGNHRPAQRRTSPPPDHGVIFESLRGSLQQRHNRDLHSMLRSLAVRQRRDREGRTLQSLHEQEMVKFRRALYRRGVRVQSIQDGGRSRETSAEFFRRNPACLHRLVPWLRRELTVLYGTHGSLVNIVQHIIMTLITRNNLDDQAVVHELRPFLLSHTEHFLHEFLSFAQSPFNMEAYDQRAVYDLPRPSGEGSSSEDSVIAISEDESDSLVCGSQDYATPSLTLSQTAWDDETPGPSYSSGPAQVLPFPVRDSDSDSSVGEAVVSVAAVPHQDHPANTGTIALEEEHSAGSDDDCFIIGYVKPASERTPELVQLSSDSEHSELNTEQQSPQVPLHIRFNSESDLSPSDTSSHARKEDKYGKGHYERGLSGSREGSSHSNRTHSSSRSKKQPLSKESKHKWRREKETSHHTSSLWHSYSHYSQRDSTRRCYTRSFYTSYRSVHDHSRSQSHSRRQSRDCHDRRSRSRSNSRIKSSFSNRQHRSRSRNRSRIKSSSSNRQHRSRSRSRSRIKSSSSNRQHRSRSRSTSRIKSSSFNRQHRSRSRSTSRIKSSSFNRQHRSRSRSTSRIKSSSFNRQHRSRSRSTSRIKSSSFNRQHRSRSRSTSRIKSSSSNRQHRSRSRSTSRIKSSSSNRQHRSRSRSTSRIKSSSSNRQHRSRSRSTSRIKSSSSNRQHRSRSRSTSRIKSSSSNRQHRSRSRSRSRIKSSPSHQTSRHDEHGRKKKYKTKHHEEPSSKLFTDSVKDDAKKKYKKHHKKFKRKSKCPSRDDKSEGPSRKHLKKKKKKHKRKSRRHNGEERVGKNSPVLITITSDSDSDSADPSEPSTSNICAAGSIVPIANSATETQPFMSRFLDMEQVSTARTGCSSVGDAGNQTQSD